MHVRLCLLVLLTSKEFQFAFEWNFFFEEEIENSIEAFSISIFS